MPGNNPELHKPNTESCQDTVLLVGQLLEALRGKGVPEDDCESVRETIMKLLEKSPELKDELSEFCKSFKENMKWISNIDGMTNLYIDLKKKWLIDEQEAAAWTIININWLNYEIYKLDPLKLDDADFIKKNIFNKKWSRIDVQERTNKTNFMQDKTFEINREHLETLSWRLWQWWKVPSDADFRFILETLWRKYSEVIKYPVNIDDTKWDKYNECGAFFMLISKIYWIILLQDGVYKAFDNYRWFRDGQHDGLWRNLNLTGQAILIRRKD